MNKFSNYVTISSLILALLHQGSFCLARSVNSSGDDNNIVIRQRTNRYEFVYGDEKNPVLINELSSAVFRCDDYRTSIPYVEWYDDKSTINEVSVSVGGKKVKDIKPKFEYYSIENIFYSDARICYFQLPFEKKGSEAEVQINKTISDPRYFSTIYFPEAYNIEHKQIVIVVPKWMHVEIREMNFDSYGISKQVEKKDNAIIYTYSVKQLDARKNESRSPGPSYIYPHLLILNKYADANGARITYFNTLADQYAWYRQLVLQIGNDKTVMKEKALEITEGISSDTGKVKAIYKYVQDNIRYIAFEDGIAGFKPAKAQDVLKKKYGDCKGMANLTKELLSGAGFDARLCWIGTNHIAYDYTTPSLAVDNHMICALRYKGKFYFLDATESYIGFDEYAERIQGRQVLIEDGDQYLLEKVPVRTAAQNIDYEKRILRITDGALSGTVEHRFTGESKGWLLLQIHGSKKDKLPGALLSYLSDNNQKYQITELKTSDLSRYDHELTIQYMLNHQDAVSGFGNELYLDMDFRKDMKNSDIDTDNRNNDLLFPYKQTLVYETELSIPAGYEIMQLPVGLTIEDAMYTFKISYKATNEKIFYRKELVIKETCLQKSSFQQWNTNIQQLTKCYNEQITLSKK